MQQQIDIRYENRIVVFIDILGFKSIIRDSERNLDKVKVIHKVLEFFKNKEKTTEWNLNFIEIEEDAQKKGLDLFNISDKINCTCFSDSIVISVSVNQNEVNAVTSTLVANISYFGMILLTEGILIRGAITIGELIHSSNGIIMGPALIEAYELEVNVAKQPRIVISNKLLNHLNYPLTTKRDRFPYHQYLKRFKDGCVGFHQMISLEVLQSWVSRDNDDDFKVYHISICEVIIRGLDASAEHPDIYSKYIWLKNEYEKLIILDEGFKLNILAPDTIRGNFFNHSIQKNHTLPIK